MEATAPLLESKLALDLITTVTPVVRALSHGIVDQLEILLLGDLATRTPTMADLHLPGLETEVTATVETVTVEIVETEVIAVIEATVATAAVTETTTTTTHMVDMATMVVVVAALLLGSRITMASRTPSITPRERLMDTLATLPTELTARLPAWEHHLVWEHLPAWALPLAFLRAVPLPAWITSMPSSSSTAELPLHHHRAVTPLPRRLLAIIHHRLLRATSLLRLLPRELRW